MTTLCIDELPARLKRRWGWPVAATNVPVAADCPLLDDALPGPQAGHGGARPGRASVPEWLRPGRASAGPPGIAAFHGKASPSMG
jgi:hypothetical protein